MVKHDRLTEYKFISQLEKIKNLKVALVRAKFCRQRGTVQGDIPWAFKLMKFLFNPQGGVGAPAVGKFTLQSQNLV